MLHLSNNHLVLTLLDPRTDTVYKGSRYCTGGFIWQIDDRTLGPLLAGPQFPLAIPPPFHGQGAPEVFVTPLGPDDVSVGKTVTIIGVGEVVRTSTIAPFHVRDNPAVHRFCEWEIAVAPDYVRMSTEQHAGSYAISLVRTVTLNERTVTSRTTLYNCSSGAIPLRWFPHPFFPFPPEGACCSFGFAWSVPENNGYFRDEEGVLRIKMQYPWEKGLFQKIDLPQPVRLEAVVRHPQLEQIVVTTDYLLESLPVWANNATFSLEPYLACWVPPKKRCEWTISYRL